MLQTVMKLAPLLSSLNQEDDSTRFLHALRPMLSNERQTKLDQASKILQLMRMLPLLRSQGILNCLQSEGVYVSAGSACARGHRSHVLQAMQAPPQAIDGSIRVSFCRESTEEMVHQLHIALQSAVKTLKG